MNHLMTITKRSWAQMWAGDSQVDLVKGFYKETFKIRSKREFESN